MKEKLDRQIALAVREVVIKLSREDAPDAATLALALASGETAQSLADKAKEKVDRRTGKTTDAPATTKPAPTTAQTTAPNKDVTKEHKK